MHVDIVASHLVQLLRTGSNTFVAVQSSTNPEFTTMRFNFQACRKSNAIRRPQHVRAAAKQSSSASTRLPRREGDSKTSPKTYVSGQCGTIAFCTTTIFSIHPALTLCGQKTEGSTVSTQTQPQCRTCNPPARVNVCPLTASLAMSAVFLMMKRAT